MRFISKADGTPSEFDGKYLYSWNVNPEGGGYEAAIVATPHSADAHHFADAAEALDAWRSRAANPLNRPDGKPNRPLTAYTIEVLTLAATLVKEGGTWLATDAPSCRAYPLEEK